MRTYTPVLPLGATIPVRAFGSFAAAAAGAVKAFVRARRNRRDALALSGLDRSMLKDIGLSRSDLNDAFSSPFWEDPTAILKERAIERRLGRALKHSPSISPGRPVESGSAGLSGPAAQAALIHCGLN
jgi:uncharacterized protein YjiS (DUF1127 family)